VTVQAVLYAGIVMVLAQTGSPSVAIGPETVGVFEAAMTPHTGNEVSTVRSGG